MCAVWRYKPTRQSRRRRDGRRPAQAPPQRPARVQAAGRESRSGGRERRPDRVFKSFDITSLYRCVSALPYYFILQAPKHMMTSRVHSWTRAKPPLNASTKYRLKSLIHEVAQQTASTNDSALPSRRAPDRFRVAPKFVELLDVRKRFYRINVNFRESVVGGLVSLFCPTVIRKLCTQWIPYNLAQGQNSVVLIGGAVIARLVGDDSNVVYDIVTDEESWIYCYHLETKHSLLSELTTKESGLRTPTKQWLHCKRSSKRPSSASRQCLSQ
ncbi:hypothetical protein EVAR_82605_1 [Eumeta japonica]|uniref:Uncharacterized protein n=1 Tax=Eumeta variegata TaxID=151549 RepID=A0A4C1X2L1_EUMVA|nr:hypothetical protein EVAR_82605_1 [Eumeta japonica]